MQISICGEIKMNILIDITHPAHVHFFKYAASEWEKNGHTVKFVAREKEITLQLLQELKIPFKKLSRIRKGILGLSIELLEHDYQLMKFVRHFKPDIMLNIGGTFIVHVGKLLGIKTCVFTDTEHAKLANHLTFPFATWICTPSCFLRDLGDNQVRYNGFQELAYLHPNYFQPNEAVLSEIGLKSSEPYFILRFIAWGASHDVGYKGLSEDNKLSLVHQLQNKGRVIITSESKLSRDLEPHKISISPDHIHDLLYYASLYIGEGATMASEAAILGVPSVYINALTAGTIIELEEKFGLLCHVIDQKQAFDLALDLASRPCKPGEKIKRRSMLIDEKIDVTSWLVEFIESIENQ